MARITRMGDAICTNFTNSDTNGEAMRRTGMGRRFMWILVAVALMAGLMACGGGDAEPVEEDVSVDEGAGYTSETLDTSYEGALPVSSQLALGTMELEGTGDAVTPEQASTLLPLWQALQGGVTVEAEVNAVLAQIERTMTEEQLSAIAAMQLTQEDTAAWAEETGIAIPFAGEGGGPGFGPGMSEDERAAIQATVEAGGMPEGFPGEMPEGFPGGGQGQGFRGGEGLSEEEREAFRATAEASGMAFPEGRTGAGRRGAGNFLIGPLVELLTERAAE